MIAPRGFSRAARAAATGMLVLAVGCAAAQEAPRDVRDMKLFRFEFDNDTFVGSDDAFTAGWSFQIHSQGLDEWPPGLEGWIGRVPTLRDDGDGERIGRWAWGITQIIITPENIGIAAPQQDDAPWAGLLGGYVSWSAYDNRRLGALQLYLGCMGPCSHAEEAQKLVHNSLGFGDSPEGWHNQLDDEWLLNVNYEYRRKLWTGRTTYDTRRFGQDLSVGAQVGLGSFATYAQASLEYRFGWGVPLGFTKFADPPAFGVALDPVYADPNAATVPQRTWRPYFNLVARLRTVDSFAALDGAETVDGGYHPGVVSAPGDEQLIFGIHIARLPLAFHLTVHRYFDDELYAAATGGELDWVNFSFERRF
jgi:hypothetical protein